MKDDYTTTEQVKSQVTEAELWASCLGDDWPGPKTTITVLRCLQECHSKCKGHEDGLPHEHTATKTLGIVDDGNGGDKVAVVRDYDAGWKFFYEGLKVRGIREFHKVLTALQKPKNSRCFIIRAFPCPGIEIGPKDLVRRKYLPDGKGKQWMEERNGQPFLPFDADHIPIPSNLDPIRDTQAVIDYVVSECLPPELQGVDFVWQLSSSYGTTEGEVSLHFWFWLDRPMTEKELKAWARRNPWFREHKDMIDKCTVNVVQPIYTAAPLNGDLVPIKDRIGLRNGGRGCASLVIPDRNEEEVAYTSLDEDDPYVTARGFEERLALIGVEGFRDPMMHAIASYVGTVGWKDLDRGALKRSVEKAVHDANADPDKQWRDEKTTERYLGQIDEMIDGAREYGEAADRRIAERGDAFSQFEDEPGQDQDEAEQPTPPPEQPDAPGPEPAEPSALDHLRIIEISDIRLDAASNWLVYGVLDQGTLACMYGDSGSGKTFTAIDLSCRIAGGEEWFGHEVQQGAVLYVACEAPNSVERRMLAWCQHHKKSPGQVWVARYPVNFLSQPKDIDALIDAVAYYQHERGVTFRLIVIDTLSRALAGGDENSPVAMGTFTRNCERLKLKTGATVLIVHHTGKDAAKGMRGHSLLRAALDTALEVRDRTITCDKERDTEDFRPIDFGIKSVHLGADDRGKPIPSAVIEPRAARREPLFGDRAMMVDALRQAVKDGGGKAVKMSEWVKAYLQQEGVQPNNARNRLGRNTKTLEDQAWVIRHGTDKNPTYELVNGPDEDFPDAGIGSCRAE